MRVVRRVLKFSSLLSMYIVTLPLFLCTACHPECNTNGARMCFGPGNDKCCNFYDEEDKCLPACNKVGTNFACTGMYLSYTGQYSGVVESYMFCRR